ncbi:DinB family protein [Paenibacillus contaminans]|uniref:DinB family protein n=1 Tax=Paenibacillus contaminans TaxID=450362 RepID=A0A329MLL0_9BACL|nr:DinB family protein [Paenibacillus contaminans]RAV19603.1 DinB family protein [Paenibacillus contaminans]
MTVRPSQEEYAPYYETYIRLVPEGKIAEVLTRQLQYTADFFAAIPEERTLSRYAPGKWSVKEVLGHITDTERIMSYRLLCIARGDKTPLPGYDENEYIKGSSFDSIPLAELIGDFAAVRRSTLTLLRGLSEEAWSRKGIANNSELSARALAYITAGHELHHINIVKERYLVEQAE